MVGDWSSDATSDSTASVTSKVSPACDSPTESDDHPVGIVFLRADGSESARYELGSGAEGSLQVPAGQAVTFGLRVITESGASVAMDGDEYSIQDARIIIATLASVRYDEPDELRITGLATGATSVHFDLMHGDHPEFEVSGVPVVIQ